MLTALAFVAVFVLGVVVGWFLFGWAVKVDHEDKIQRPPRIPPAG